MNAQTWFNMCLIILLLNEQVNKSQGSKLEKKMPKDAFQRDKEEKRKNQCYLSFQTMQVSVWKKGCLNADQSSAWC